MHATGLDEQSPSVNVAAYVGFVSAVLFAILTAMVLADRTAALDRALILSLRADASPVRTTMLLAVTFTSGRLAIPAALLFAFALYRRSGTRAVICYVAACITGQVLDALLKFDVSRVRPHGVSPRLTAAGGFAYPSADAMMAVLVFGLGAYMLSRTVRSPWIRATMLITAAAFIVVAAVARVYLGAHWPSDVLGGVLAGIACAGFFVSAMQRSPVSLVDQPLQNI
jgi:undecaprenyl-diphosphatase